MDKFLDLVVLRWAVGKDGKPNAFGRWLLKAL